MERHNGIFIEWESFRNFLSNVIYKHPIEIEVAEEVWWFRVVDGAKKINCTEIEKLISEHIGVPIESSHLDDTGVWFVHASSENNFSYQLEAADKHSMLYFEWEEFRAFLSEKVYLRPIEIEEYDVYLFCATSAQTLYGCGDIDKAVSQFLDLPIYTSHVEENGVWMILGKQLPN